MKFLNENSMSRVLISKLTESVNSTDSSNIVDKLKAAQSLEELENMLKDIVKDDKEFGLSVFGEINQGEVDGKSFEDIKDKVIEEVAFKINNPDEYNMKNNDFNESKDLNEDAWDDNFVISALQNDKVYWKRKSDGKEIVTSFDVFTEPTDPTEWKSEEELSQYALEEDLGPAQKVYNKKVLNNRKQVNTAKNSATNLNEDSYESGIFYEIEEALREAGLNPTRFNEDGIMTNNIGWTVTGEDGTEQQITCDGSYLDDEENNQ